MERKVLPRMMVKEITGVINKGIVKNKTVKIQVNKCDSNGIFETPVVGRINGYINDELYMSCKLRIKINEIRSAKLE